MDDHVLIEIMFGRRPFMSSRRADRGTLEMLGKAAKNLAKDVVEGKAELDKIIWGILFSTLDKNGEHFGPGTATLPEAKRVKVQELLRESGFNPEQFCVKIHTLQKN